MGRRKSTCKRVDANRRDAISYVERVLVEFKCPECDTTNTNALMYIPHKRGKEHPATCTSAWCRRCQLRMTIDYRVFKRRNGTPKLKIFSLSSPEKEFKKRIKVLAWC